MSDAPEPRYARFRLTYPSGTVVEAYYGEGATLEEVRVTHPLATVEVCPEIAERLEETTRVRTKGDG